MERRQMSDQGWLGPNNPEATLTVEEAYRRRLKEGEVELQFQLWLDRRVQAEYSRVALRQMYRLAKDAGVPLNTVKPTDIGFSLSDELQPIATQITHHINEGHPLQLMPKEEAYRRRLKEGEVELQFQLWLDRRVQAEYSRVALRQMYRLAKDAGVPFDTLNPALEEYALPDELQPIATQITCHINEGQPLQLSMQEEALLRQRYIHHSAHYQTAGPLFPFKPAPGGVRGVYPNRGFK